VAGRTLGTLLALAATVATMLPNPATASARRSFDLYFDAIFTKLSFVDQPPAGESRGDRQIASGGLRDRSNRAVGRFAFTCVYRRVINGDALERCTGWALTTDGRVDFAGPAVQSDADHTWKLTRGTNRYRGVTGTLVVHDIGDHESLATANLTLAGGAALTAGVIGRPAANRAFIARADAVCDSANRALAKLPPFPFSNFDPLHPDPSVLPAVGRFFTGRGDPRKILKARVAGLERLGRLPAQRSVWQRYLSARRDELSNINAQDRAALSANRRAFVLTVRREATVYRGQAIAATLFGAYPCRN
jgi:hypothetical protein